MNYIFNKFVFIISVLIFITTLGCPASIKIKVINNSDENIIVDFLTYGPKGQFFSVNPKDTIEIKLIGYSSFLFKANAFTISNKNGDILAVPRVSGEFLSAMECKLIYPLDQMEISNIVNLEKTYIISTEDISSLPARIKVQYYYHKKNYKSCLNVINKTNIDSLSSIESEIDYYKFGLLCAHKLQLEQLRDSFIRKIIEKFPEQFEIIKESDPEISIIILQMKSLS
jgi:hypothetical protein